MTLDIDNWLSENHEACIDDFMKALIADEEKWKSENNGVLIDDHLLSYDTSIVNLNVFVWTIWLMVF